MSGEIIDNRILHTNYSVTIETVKQPNGTYVHKKTESGEFDNGFFISPVDEQVIKQKNIAFIEQDKRRNTARRTLTSDMLVG